MNLTMRYQHKNYCCPEDQILIYIPKKAGRWLPSLFVLRIRSCSIHPRCGHCRTPNEMGMDEDGTSMTRTKDS